MARICAYCTSYLSLESVPIVLVSIGIFEARTSSFSFFPRSSFLSTLRCCAFDRVNYLFPYPLPSLYNHYTYSSHGRYNGEGGIQDEQEAPVDSHGS